MAQSPSGSRALVGRPARPRFRPADPGPPPGVRAMLRGRLRRTLRAVDGRVVDLGGSLGGREDYPPDVAPDVTFLEGDGPELAAGLERSGPVDTVVSRARLAHLEEPSVVIGAIGRRLGSEGRLVFLEPDAGPGAVARGGARLWSLAGVAVHGDLTLRLWAGGLTVLRVRRFTVPTLAVPYRSWVWGVARSARVGERP